MLDHHVVVRPAMDRRGASAEDEVTWSMQEARIVLRKYGVTILVTAAAFFALALLYTTTATRHYTAYARLLIDSPRNPISSLDGTGSTGGGGGGLAVPEVESQLQVLVSDRLGFKVMSRLQLDKRSIAPPPKLGLVERAVRAAKEAVASIPKMFSDPPRDVEPERAALARLLEHLTVRRVGASYVVEIGYTSPDPQFAAEVANAFAETYVQDQVDTKAEVWKRASMWLQDRVNELRSRSEEAARAAQDFKAQFGNNAETWPRARELDRTAEAYDALYSAFLKRYTDSVQQQTFPITEARIIGQASRPAVPSKPQSALIIALMTLMGLGIGSVTAFVRWRLDRTIRSPGQIQRYGLRCLTTLPRLPKPISRDKTQVVRTVMRAPRSQFTENLRLLRAEISLAERTRPMRYIGVTSALPGEGKTTVAANLAQLFASVGPTLVIDADVRNPQLTEALAPLTTPRALDARAAGQEGLPVPVPGCPGLSFLSVVNEFEGVGSNWFEQGGFEALLEENKQRFSRIIVDLPPASVIAEARYAAPILDAILVVVEWETTPADAFLSCVDACDVDPGKVFGIVLNKVHPSVITRSQGSTAYSNDYLEPERATPAPARGGRLRI